MKLSSYLAILAIFLFASCSKEDPDPNVYLESWLGTYSGISIHSSTTLSDTGYITDVIVRIVTANVQNGSVDSTVNIRVVYDETDLQNYTDVKISSSGFGQTAWGGGSTYGSLDVHFQSDSLTFKLFQNQGMLSSSSVNFTAGKN